MHIKTIDTLVNVIEKYLESTDRVQRYRLINVNNNDNYIDVLNRLLPYFDTVKVSDYCNGSDTIPNIESLLKTISSKKGRYLVLGLSQHLKFLGRVAFNGGIQKIMSKSNYETRVVFLCYDIESILVDNINNDIRYFDTILLLQGNRTESEQIRLLGDISLQCGVDIFNDYRSYIKSFEQTARTGGIIATQYRFDLVSGKMLSISTIENGFDLICLEDIAFDSKVHKEEGSNEQWNWLTKEKGNHSIKEYASFMFGDLKNMYMRFIEWEKWSTNIQWFFYISLKFEEQTRPYLSLALQRSKNVEMFIHNLYFAILDISYNNEIFDAMYFERKEILRGILNLDVLTQYCIFISGMEMDRIYYLTDLTALELENVFEWLSKIDKIDEVAIKTIQKISPALKDYLESYDFKDKGINDYFDQYKRQKLNNRIYPEFLTEVNSRAISRDYNLLFPSRNEIYEQIDKTDCRVYFLDALGVEFLGYIVRLAQKMAMQISIKVVRANIPTSTEYNKEFLPVQYVDIKKLDKIKHSGENGFDYELNKLPLHLPKELEIIDEVLKKIKTELATVSKVILVSDHGASRLVVINDHKIRFDVDLDGSTGGRFCKYNEGIDPIEYATIENDKYVLANYDRFKSYATPRVETHGGATLEEVLVPIIEFTRLGDMIAADLVDQVLKIDFRSRLELKVRLSCKLTHIFVRIDGKTYESETTSGYLHVVPIEDIKKTGKYIAEIYNGDNIIGQIQFSVEKTAAKEIDLF